MVKLDEKSSTMALKVRIWVEKVGRFKKSLSKYTRAYPNVEMYIWIWEGISEYKRQKVREGYLNTLNHIQMQDT